MKKIIFALSLLVFISGCAETDLCKDVVCQNDGVCESGDCICEDGFEGTKCETEWRTKFLGTYSFSDVCPSSPTPYTGTATVTVSSTNNVTLLLSNFGGIGTGAVINGTIAEANRVTVTSGAANGYIINTATGTIANNIINWTYTITDNGGANESCTSAWTKQ